MSQYKTKDKKSASDVIKSTLDQILKRSGISNMIAANALRIDPTRVGNWRRGKEIPYDPNALFRLCIVASATNDDIENLRTVVEITDEELAMLRKNNPPFAISAKPKKKKEITGSAKEEIRLNQRCGFVPNLRRF